MSKNKDQKRKAQLAVRAKNESFRFQVEYTKKTKRYRHHSNFDTKFKYLIIGTLII